MPIYDYQCSNHGIIELWQGMNDEHVADCPICNKPMRRVYTPSYVPTHPKIGNDRVELFNNLAQDGFMNKEWKQYDSYYKAAIGAET